MSATPTGFSARCCDNDYLDRDQYSEHMKAEHPRMRAYRLARLRPARLGTSPLTAVEKQWLGKRVILDDGRVGHVWSLVGPGYVLADPECDISVAHWRKKRVIPTTPHGNPADIAVVVDGALVLARTDQTVFAPPSWEEAVECRINL